MLLLGCGSGSSGSPGVRGVLSEAGDDAAGGPGAEGAPGEREGTSETGAAEPVAGVRGAAGETEADRAAAPRSPGRH